MLDNVHVLFLFNWVKSTKGPVVCSLHCVKQMAFQIYYLLYLGMLWPELRNFSLSCDVNTADINTIGLN